MSEETRKQQKDSNHRKQENERQAELEFSRLALEAGRNMTEIPKFAKGNEPMLQEYKTGLQDARKEMETIPNSRVGSGVTRLEREVDRAIIEAQQVREAVGREKAHATDFHKHAEPGETYRGRVIGRTDSFVIQSDDSRPGSVVLHDRAAVSGAEKVRMNEHAEISYPHGRAGIVRPPQQRQMQGQQHQHQQKAASHEHER
ncbi:KfrB domain-containing protein [Brucella cytisi]|uniref:KfrB domain-containing protein n=1 Tax=Brucella cytisi TaxID=407152 RepID=A0A1J6HPY1_9HYPH|nr:hypothetical protein [Brucella cytisi]OIS90223.1 hypothetical protein BLA27_27935 [Brucella cytisi]